jgi:8-oxo-dGTP pyrophosphatase MutT (NUDIX family)
LSKSSFPEVSWECLTETAKYGLVHHTYYDCSNKTLDHIDIQTIRSVFALIMTDINQGFYLVKTHRGAGLPGGKVESQDISLRDTILREVYEEVGITLDQDTIIPLQNIVSRSDQHRFDKSLLTVAARPKIVHDEWPRATDSLGRIFCDTPEQFIQSYTDGDQMSLRRMILQAGHIFSEG